jgi:hypothetical protein
MRVTLGPGHNPRLIGAHIDRAALDNHPTPAQHQSEESKELLEWNAVI